MSFAKASSGGFATSSRVNTMLEWRCVPGSCVGEIGIRRVRQVVKAVRAVRADAL